MLLFALKTLRPLTYKFWATGLSKLNFLFNWLRNLDSRPRLGLSIMFGMTVFLLVPASIALDTRILAGWTSGILLFLTVIFVMMNGTTPQKTLSRSQRQEAQHAVVFLLVIATACTSIFAIALMQIDNQNLSELALVTEEGLSIAAIICSWLLTHTTFALHYAALYYSKDCWLGQENCDGGLNFPGEELPDYWDFMYFSFTIGMTAQTSDVAITSNSMRQLSLAHGLVAFFFYMVILASGVNTASGLI
jgi:uncharacterized membrane protein